MQCSKPTNKLFKLRLVRMLKKFKIPLNNKMLLLLEIDKKIEQIPIKLRNNLMKKLKNKPLLIKKHGMKNWLYLLKEMLIIKEINKNYYKHLIKMLKKKLKKLRKKLKRML